MTAKSIKRDTGLDALIIVEWEDCIGYTQLDGDWIIKTGGRVDRNDWQDIEPVVHIPVTEFTILEIK